MAKARILAVDDQRYFRELIAGMLAEEGFEAQTASSAEEALHILEHNDFDIFGWADVLMPATQCGHVAPQGAATRFQPQDLCLPVGTAGGN